MLKYFNSINFNNNTYSCDMLRLSFIIPINLDNSFRNYLDYLSLDYNLHQNNFIYLFNVYHSLKQCCYRNLVTIKNYTDASVTIGFGFNGFKKEDMIKCFIEFNPNKCLCDINFNWFKILFKWFLDNNITFELVRFDLAIDLPINRLLVALQKDNRVYQLYYGNVQINSIADFTEYLGSRNKNGFVKIYNKTIESKLDYDCTRVEISLDNFNFDNFVNSLPKIYFLDNKICLDNLKQTDLAIFQLLMQQPQPYQYLSFFGRDKKEKFQNIIGETIKLQPDYYVFSQIIQNIQKIIDKKIFY